MSSELNGVQAKVKDHAPDAIFIHCYAHRLNLVLSQAASSNAKCNVFFSTFKVALGGLSTFLQHQKECLCWMILLRQGFQNLLHLGGAILLD